MWYKNDITCSFSDTCGFLEMCNWSASHRKETIIQYTRIRLGVPVGHEITLLVGGNTHIQPQAMTQFKVSRYQNFAQERVMLSYVPPTGFFQISQKFHSIM